MRYPLGQQGVGRVMASEYLVAIYILAGGAAIVAGASTLPPLTAPGGASATYFDEDPSQTELSEAAELAYCQGNTRGVNCQCFASVSGHIMAIEEKRIRGAYYVDRTMLARSQAKRTC